MLKRFALIASAALATGAFVPATADAQMENGRATLPPAGSTRKGVIVEAPPKPVVPDPIYQNPSYPGNYYGARPVAFVLVPAIIMSDGSIYGNFGHGYEPVHRTCSGAVVVGQTQRVGANGVVLPDRNRLPYTPPVPNQQTPSQQMVNQTNTLSAAAQTGCFSRDNSGRVFVYRKN